MGAGLFIMQPGNMDLYIFIKEQGYSCHGSWLVEYLQGMLQLNNQTGYLIAPNHWTQKYDPSRLVDPAGGGNYYHVGDMLDLHNYPATSKYLFDGNRANTLDEYGRIELAAEEHLWVPDRNWGYVQLKMPKKITNEYVKYVEQLLKMIKTDFSAAVYTQTTDVEIKEGRVHEINLKICHALNENTY